LVQHYSEFCNTLTKLAKTRHVQEEVHGALNSITTFIQKFAAGKVQSVWEGLKRGGEIAGKGGERAGEVLFGKGAPAAKHLGTATRAGVTYGVPLLGAEIAHEHMTQGPIGSRVTRAASEHLPVYMSQAARERRYRVQQGM
jgi:hypothetical protein